MTSTLSATPRLIGREVELGILFGLVDRASERGGALVVRGQPGIGKTSLLVAATRHATDRGLRVLSTGGVEPEAHSAFSGLHRLLLPLWAGTEQGRLDKPDGTDGLRNASHSLFDGLEHLPEPQRDALATAFGVGVGPAPDPFLVGLAALNLLAIASEQQALLCVIDDAQWLDRVSVQTLGFAARRLSDESVVILFAASEPGEDFRGLPELVVEGLSARDALGLLDSVVPGAFDERVRERIVAEARGNPLALVELPRSLSLPQLAGGFGPLAATPKAHSLAGRIEESFLLRIETMPTDTRLLLLAAAAEPVGDAALLWRATERLGIPYEALSPAASAGVLEVDHRVRFRHPLVRSAVYRTSSLNERQRVHRALAESIDSNLDPDRRVWHRAHAAVGPDEDIAAQLERSASRAEERGGLAAAAAFLERAVGLTVDPALRSERALAAARAKFEAAATDAASKLLAAAELGPLDNLQRARAERLRAQIAFAQCGSADVPGLCVGPEAPALLLQAAKRLEPLDVELARETYLDALTTAMLTGSLSPGCGVEAVAEAARAAPAGPEPPRTVDVILDGLTARFTKPYTEAAPALKEALHSIAATDDHGDDSPGLLWFVCPVTPEPLAPELWEDEAWHALASRAVRRAREAGALALLPNALTHRACLHVLSGEFGAASALIDEAYAIAEATGSAPLRYPSLMLAAWRGQEAAAHNVIEAGTQDARARGLGRAISFAQWATALLYNGLGRYQDALGAAQRACAHEDVGFFGWALKELVDAAARTDAREVASEALRQLAERTRASGTDWALGIEAGSRALVSDGEVAERLYREAIERLSRTRIRVEIARARLHYGEWLRRERRRVDARDQLRRAHDEFASTGAEAFAERARRELVATGATARRRQDETRGELTAWEEQIARLAREGLTNPQIGAQLFISPRTVEWHLRNVYTKLGISSRRHLHAGLPDNGPAVSPGRRQHDGRPAKLLTPPEYSPSSAS
jgi:DNA-binding CsgD family transcriptional regulator